MAREETERGEGENLRVLIDEVKSGGALSSLLMTSNQSSRKKLTHHVRPTDF